MCVLSPNLLVANRLSRNETDEVFRTKESSAHPRLGSQGNLRLLLDDVALLCERRGDSTKYDADRRGYDEHETAHSIRNETLMYDHE